MLGERIRRDRFTQAGAATGTVRASERTGTAEQGGTRLSPRVLSVCFTADANGNILLRHGPAGGVADTDFAGPYYLLATGQNVVKVKFPPGTADIDPGNVGRDLFYVVTVAGGVNWTLEVVTEMR